jgi:hypothetical protein
VILDVAGGRSRQLKDVNRCGDSAEEWESDMMESAVSCRWVNEPNGRNFNNLTNDGRNRLPS